RVRLVARAGGVRLLVTYPPRKACPSLRPPAVCATRAGSISDALSAAPRMRRPVVVSITRLSQLAALARAARGRIVAVVPYRLTGAPSAWRAAIATAVASTSVDLAVASPATGLAPPSRAFPRPAEAQPAPAPPPGGLPPPPPIPGPGLPP